MHGQLTQQGLELALVAQQPQVRLVQHGGQQPVYGQFRNAVRDAQVQPQGGAGGGFAHPVRQLLAQRKDLIGLVHGRHAGIGQHQVAALAAQQAHAQGFFQFAHLSADGLHRHVQPLCRPGNAALFGHHPEVIQVAVIEALAHGALRGFVQSRESGVIWFVKTELIVPR